MMTYNPKSLVFDELRKETQKSGSSLSKSFSSFKMALKLGCQQGCVSAAFRKKCVQIITKLKQVNTMLESY